jgi:PilZ domain-containing protein
MKRLIKRSMPTKERRHWARLSLAIPVFVRGINGQGREFLEFSTLLNESAGGVLLAMRKPLRLWSRVSLEIPCAQILKSVNVRRAVRMLRARVIRITYAEGWNLCGLQFARPLV